MPKLKHIALSTQDVEGRARFYVEVFGATSTWPSSISRATPAGSALRASAVWKGTPDVSTSGYT